MARARVIFHPFPVNLRLSSEKLMAAGKEAGSQLNSGDIFIFFNKKRDRCRIVWNDGRCLNDLEKVLQKGSFAPTDKIQIDEDLIDDFVWGGIEGQARLLHALRGNVSYIEDVRDRPLD